MAEDISDPKNGQKNHGHKNWLFHLDRHVVAAIVIVVGALLVGLIWQGMRKARESANTDMNNQTEALYFEVPELGIRFPRPKELSDLIYKVSKDKRAASFSSQSILAAEQSYGNVYCVPVSREALGELAIAERISYWREPSAPMIEIPLADGRVLAYWHPQAVCTPYQKVIPLLLEKRDAFIKAVESAKSMSPGSMQKGL